MRAAVDAKAKPLGALGRIEELAIHIGLVAGSLKPNLGRAAIVVFAGDHGIVAEGVTAYPSEVSPLIAQMVLEGRAGANIAARAVGAEVFVIDAGLKTPLASKAAGAGRRMSSKPGACSDCWRTGPTRGHAQFPATSRP